MGQRPLGSKFRLTAEMDIIISPGSVRSEVQLVVMVEPRPRCGHSAVAARGKLYVWGGKDGSSEVQFARIESFRVRDGRWEGGQEMQTVGFVPRQLYHTAIACGEGAVFSFGGSSGPSERLDRCYRIDVSPPTCTEFCIEGAPPARRSFGGVVYFDRTLVLYGGHTGEGGRDVSGELFVLDLQKSEKYIYIYLGGLKWGRVTPWISEKKG